MIIDAALSGYNIGDICSTPKSMENLRVGVPLYPFVHAYVPKGGDNPFNYTTYPEAFTPSVEQMLKYESAKAALHNAGVTLVQKEWPNNENGVNILASAFYLQQFNGAAISMNYHVFHTYMGQVWSLRFSIILNHCTTLTINTDDAMLYQ